MNQSYNDDSSNTYYVCNCYNCSKIFADCDRCIWDGANRICIGCNNDANNKYLAWGSTACVSNFNKLFFFLIRLFIGSCPSGTIFTII